MPCSVAVSKADVASSQIRSRGALQGSNSKADSSPMHVLCASRPDRQTETTQLFAAVR